MKKKTSTNSAVNIKHRSIGAQIRAGAVRNCRTSVKPFSSSSCDRVVLDAHAAWRIGLTVARRPLGSPSGVDLAHVDLAGDFVAADRQMSAGAR